MKNKRSPLNIPFNVEYTIRFSGKTQSDGIQTVTSQMIRDKIIAVLEEMLRNGYIREYNVSAENKLMEV